jgi:hypothetical protein
MRKIAIAIQAFFILAVAGLLFFSFFSADSATLQNGMNASYVLGGGGATQDFSSNATGTSASLFSNYINDVVFDDVNYRLYVADTLNQRILVFDTDSNGNPLDHVADYVLGQEDFVTNGTNLDADGFDQLNGIVIDADRQLLFVSDYLGSQAQESGRVMVFDLSGGITNGMDATYVLGQPDFISTQNPTTTQNTFRHAQDLQLDRENDRLFVTDLYRVMVFDVRDPGSPATLLCGESTTGLATYMNASCVIGQDDFTSEVSTTTGSGLIWYAVEYMLFDPIDDYLYLSDKEANRLLIFDLSGGITNGMSASYVLGQDDFVSIVTTTAINASKFSVVYGSTRPIPVTRTADGKLFVSDTSNSRIMIYDISSGITNGMDATYVLGNTSSLTEAASLGATQNGFLGAWQGVYFEAGKKLYVIDSVNHRVLMFDLTPSGGSSTTPQCSISATPQTITEGQSVTLNWEAIGSGSHWWQLQNNLNAYNSEATQDTFTPTETTEYTMAVVSPWGAKYCQTTVVVEPAPEPESNPLTCDAYIAPNTITLGEITTLSWNIAGGTPPYDTTGEQSPLTILGEEVGSFEFVVTANDSLGTEAMCTAELTVLPASVEPEPTPEGTPENNPLTCTATFTPSVIQPGQQSTLNYTVEGGAPPYETSTPNNYTATYNTNHTQLITVIDAAGVGYSCAAGLTVQQPQAAESEDVTFPPTDTEIEQAPAPVETLPTEDINDIIIPDVIPEDTPPTEPQPQEPAPTPQPTNNSINEILSNLRDTANSPAAQAAVALAGLVGLMTALGGAFASSIGASEIVLLPTRLWNLFLSFLGIKKQSQPWGRVYDSNTKQPLDPVYVVLTNTTTNEQQTAITDMDGRYSFIVDTPGTYRLTANKKDYSFPSQKLQGNTTDHLYQDLYFGEPFQIQGKGQVITKNIPLDATNVNWNEQDKLTNNRLKFYKKADYTITALADIFFYLGFTIAIIALVTFPVLYNIIIVTLYILFAILKKQGIKGRPHGEVTDTQGNPIPHAILRLISPTLQKEIKHAVADKYGRYHLLTNNGQYNLSIEERDQETLLQKKDMPIEVRRGYVNDSFEI